MKTLSQTFVVAALALTPSLARGLDEPDYSRAYVLATASYCVNAISATGADSDVARAVKCLNSVAAADGLLDELAVGPENVDAFVTPDGKDAYLLINGKKGLILAFRGTILPPADLSAKTPLGAALGPAANKPAETAKDLSAFVLDWLNNAFVPASDDHQHSGFRNSWRALKSHLEEDCDAAPAKPCSKLKSFLAKPATGSAPIVFITGHSKGGALATLATRNPPASLKGVDLVTYTFAGAKSLDSDGVNSASAQEKRIWRFEQDGDVVPSAPLDASVAKDPLLAGLRLPVYEHVGARVLFNDDGGHVVTRTENHVDPPGDKTRLAATSKDFSSILLLGLASGKFDASVIDRLLANEIACRRIFDRHAVVFSSVRGLARSRATNAEPSEDFFALGVFDGKNQILFGYRQWCDLLKPQ